jgi:hypothetical protein
MSIFLWELQKDRILKYYSMALNYIVVNFILFSNVNRQCVTRPSHKKLKQRRGGANIRGRVGGFWPAASRLASYLQRMTSPQLLIGRNMVTREIYKPEIDHLTCVPTNFNVKKTATFCCFFAMENFPPRFENKQ